MDFKLCLFFFAIIIIPLASCSIGMEQTLSPSPQNTSPPPTLTRTSLPTSTPQNTKTAPPTNTPTLTATPTPNPTTTPLPDCEISDQEGNLYALSDKLLFHPGPGGEVLDQALAETYPTWASFRQQPDWYDEPVTAGQIIQDASVEMTFQLNATVTLATVGVDLDWQLPDDGDLFSKARETGEKLVLNSLEWSHPDNEHIRSQYPEVSNGATYALYKYFDFNKAALQEWCESYIALFDKSPKDSP